MSYRFLFRCIAIAALAAAMGGCAAVDRLRNIGEQPALTQI